MLKELPAAGPKTSEEETDESVVRLDEKGVLQINGHAVAKEQVVAALSKLKTETAKIHHKLLITLVVSEQTKYKDVTELMDLIKKADISDVTFTIGSEEP